MHMHANQIRCEVNALSARYGYISNVRVSVCVFVSVALNWSIGLCVCLAELLIVFGCFVSQN